jgi:hypothetical protein
LETWPIDTPLFTTLSPLSSQRSGLRHWLDTHREPVFLSTASLVEIEAAIERVPPVGTDGDIAIMRVSRSLGTLFHSILIL